MAEKLYRVRVSKSLDQDIIGFLEHVPASRRSELFRHIIRYYVIQLKDDGERFILTEAPHQSDTYPNYQYKLDESKVKDKEYKIRLNEAIDRQLIEVVERVPRKRRSEFWRHVLRYYMSHLKDDEIFIMPTEVVQSNVVEKESIQSDSETNSIFREAPGDELQDFDLNF